MNHYVVDEYWRCTEDDDGAVTPTFLLGIVYSVIE